MKRRLAAAALFPGAHMWADSDRFICAGEGWRCEKGQRCARNSVNYGRRRTKGSRS
jgi:hypothetical protein